MTFTRCNYCNQLSDPDVRIYDFCPVCRTRGAGFRRDGEKMPESQTICSVQNSSTSTRGVQTCQRCNEKRESLTDGVCEYCILEMVRDGRPF